jgi:KaiC/GvpD/RAD55 family RecA-like ATPase
MGKNARLQGGPLKVASLEHPGVQLRHGYDAWNGRGRLIVRTLSAVAMWKRKPAYFRVNDTKKFYAVLSRERTEEIPAAAIEWKKAEEVER